MAEYAGYVAPTPIDFGAISSGLLSNKLTAEKLRNSEQSDALKLLQKQQAAEAKLKTEEQKQESANEKSLREDLKGIQNPEPIINKTYTDFVSKLAQSSREKIVELNAQKNKGEITSNEYLMAVNNITNGVKQYIDISKTYGANLQELTTSISKNEQSPIGVFKIGKYANAGQYNNKIVQPADGTSGVLEYYTIDANGNKVKDQTIPNIDVLKSKDLYSDRVVDYNALFKAADESIGAYKKEVGSTIISSKLKREGIDTLVAKKANEIIPLDDDKARLLAVKLGYGIYSDEQEKQIALQQMYPITADREKAIKDGSAEKRLIKYKLSDKGAWTPALTDDQKATAIEYAKYDIKSRFEYSELLDEPQRFTVNTGDKKMPASNVELLDILESSQADWNQIKSQGLNSNAAKRVVDMFTSANGTPVTLEWDGPNLKVVRTDASKKQVVMTIRGEEGMFNLYTPKDRKGSEWWGYDKAKKLYKSHGFNNY